MNKQERERIVNLHRRLSEAGFMYDQIEAMRKASKALSRWCERECNGEIERDEESGKPFAVFNGFNSKTIYRRPVRDLELASRKRLFEIVSESVPGWGWYYQTDPRGCAVYLYRFDDLGDKDISSVYSSIGIAVY